jgi:hypothetical protein
MLVIEDFPTVFNYTVQRLTTLLFNVHSIFENDLTRAHELNDPGRPLPQGQPGLCLFHRGSICADNAPKAGRVVGFDEVSNGSTTSAARQSSGSKKASSR